MDVTTEKTKHWLLEVLGVDFDAHKHNYSHQDIVFEIQTKTELFFLKIAANLQPECDNLRRVAPFLNVPVVISFRTFDSLDHLLISGIPGKNLAQLVGEKPDVIIVQKFARAVKTLHALDVNLVFPGKAAPGLVVLHGDMALPNIMCRDAGPFSYIDLGQMTVGSADIDLADAIWSLQRNLGPGFGELFLDEYGATPRTAKIEKALQFRHQDSPPA